MYLNDHDILNPEQEKRIRKLIQESIEQYSFPIYTHHANPESNQLTLEAIDHALRMLNTVYKRKPDAKKLLLVKFGKKVGVVDEIIRDGETLEISCWNFMGDFKETISIHDQITFKVIDLSPKHLTQDIL